MGCGEWACWRSCMCLSRRVRTIGRVRLLREGEGAEAEDSKGRSSSKDGNGWGGVWVGVFLGWAKTREQKGMYGLERK